MSHKSIIYYIYIASLSSVSSNIPYDFYMHNSLRITKTSGIVINLLLIDSNLRAIRNRLKNLKKNAQVDRIRKYQRLVRRDVRIIGFVVSFFPIHAKHHF